MAKTITSVRSSNLRVIDYTEKAAKILKGRRPAYAKCAMNVLTYLERAFSEDDDVLGITHRIKTIASLKEKIFRKGLYKMYDEEELFAHISDIIGVKIDCRFLEHENKIFEKLRRIFTIKGENNYYRAKDNTDIYLKVGSPQPELQKNNYSIYRIDGYIQVGDVQRFRFELQIKSLVNSFWGEIEHKIIYKNKKYLLIDGFITELMGSIHDNLHNIDKQLSMLYHRALDNTSETFFDQNKNLLVMILNTVYSDLVESKLGIAINVKEHSETLVNYIVSDSSFSGDGSEYGGLILKLINRMRDLRNEKIAIGKEIKIHSYMLEDFNKTEKAIADKIFETFNDDFYVNLFFHMLCHVEVGDEVEDFKRFIRYYAERITRKKNKESIENILEQVGQMDASTLLKESTIKKLEKTNICKM